MRKERSGKILLAIVIVIVGSVLMIGCRLQPNTKAESLSPGKDTGPGSTNTISSNSKRAEEPNANSHPVVDQTADENFWVGSYAHDRVESDPGDGFVSLEVKREKSGLVAISRYGQVQAIGSDRYKVNVAGTTASFYYDNCVQLEDEEEPCKVYGVKKGDLMFKLVKSETAKGKTVILTYGVKDDSVPKGKVYFKRFKAE